MYKVARGVCFWVGSILLLSGCSIPQDSRGTLKKVEGDTLIVGVTEHAPWVVRTGETPTGREVEQVQALAQDLGATVLWQWGPADALMEALEQYQLDLVIGGLTARTPWRKKVALTRPYVTMPIMVGVPPGVAVPKDIEGVQVFVERGTALVAILEDKGAIPMQIEKVETASGPAVASAWEVARWRWKPTRFVLRKDRHVMALPAGENAWLKRVDTFLRTHPLEAVPHMEDVP